MLGELPCSGRSEYAFIAADAGKRDS